jgi:hypothetical protein
MIMTPDSPSRLTTPLIGLQFAAFGWRINREISVGDAGRRQWLPLPDRLNVLSMAAVIAFLIVIPLVTDEYYWLSRIVLGVGYVLLGFHPITMAAHYRLFSREGRAIYTNNGKDYPKVTGQEWVSLVISLIVALISGLWIVGKL